ncbi:MAG: hypothetical protein MJ252_25850 [archaeon]|nr:hypothetical protein [archaeon]
MQKKGKSTKKEEPTEKPGDLAEKDYKEHCDTHDSKDKDVWLCYDCKKFTCTKCYAKEHKHCWADLVDNMYDEMKTTNSSNLEAVKEMNKEFQEQVDFMKKKYEDFKENNVSLILFNIISHLI